MATGVRVLEEGTELRVVNLRTRMPFRFGITTMTAMPHLLVRVACEVDGRVEHGVAADHLPPKWFTKDPGTTYRADVEAMVEVIQGAIGLARGRSGSSPFDLWLELYAAQREWASDRHPPLLWGFGVSLVERAVIDAFCRARGESFARAVRANSLGLRLGAVHPELERAEPGSLLPPAPLRSVALRHTVGLADPLTEAEIAPEQRIGDGLPQSLEASVRRYGLDHFKLKIAGDAEADLERLGRIADVLGATAGDRYRVTLDGNEQYREVGAFRDFWERLHGSPAARPLLERLLFVEQPLHRDATLTPETAAALGRWSGRPPIIIDEADATPESLPAALAAGYAGTSHKNCKGVFKGIANACLLEHRRRGGAPGPLLMSGEDLTNIAPVALQQDLAVMATLGIDHVERNGHHYFTGLSMLPAAMQEAVLAGHPDLFQRLPSGVPTLAVEQGRVRLDSVVDAPFGVALELEMEGLTPLSGWRFESLGLSEAV